MLKIHVIIVVVRVISLVLVVCQDTLVKGPNIEINHVDKAKNFEYSNMDITHLCNTLPIYQQLSKYYHKAW